MPGVGQRRQDIIEFRVLPCFGEHIRVHDGVNTAEFQEMER